MMGMGHGPMRAIAHRCGRVSTSPLVLPNGLVSRLLPSPAGTHFRNPVPPPTRPACRPSRSSSGRQSRGGLDTAGTESRPLPTAPRRLRRLARRVSLDPTAAQWATALRRRWPAIAPQASSTADHTLPLTGLEASTPSTTTPETAADTPSTRPRETEGAAPLETTHDDCHLSSSTLRIYLAAGARGDAGHSQSPLHSSQDVSSPVQPLLIWRRLPHPPIPSHNTTPGNTLLICVLPLVPPDPN